MKANIFYIDKDQAALYSKIAALLREFVYSDIEIKACPIDRDYNRNSWNENHVYGEMFVGLLRKSMITLNDFSVVVKKREDDSYCYLGYEYYKPHSMFSKYIELYNDDILSVFPAVTLLNRMVMMPEGVSKLISKEKFRDPEFDYLLKPFNMQGLKLVDFENESEMRSQLSDVSVQIKNEIKQYYNRYIQQFAVPNPKLGKLYNLLDIKEKYFEDNKAEFATKNFQIDVKVLSGQIKASQENNVTISLTNNTKDVQLGTIYMEIKAPTGAMNNNFKETVNFSGKAGEAQNVNFNISPRTAPCCPVEISFHLAGEHAGLNIFPIPLILDVVN